MSNLVEQITPEAAIAALSGHTGPALLDLDETLYFSNSTEDFIDLARPGLLALLSMRLLDLIKPWRWTGGVSTRDVWRVRLILLLFPWTIRRWRRHVGSLAAQFANGRLINAASLPRLQPIIVTSGFRPLVEPLIAALGLADWPLIATRFSSFDDRRHGKLAMTTAALGADTVGRSLVITDSTDDASLLDTCAHPCLTVWPEARFRRALGRVYLPGQYLSLVKRPGERYILRGIIQEDFAFWILGSIALAAFPAMHVFGLIGLLVSFWAIYERGYVDNDLIASRFEAEPTLSEAFAEAPVATPRVQPWIWAAVAGLGGIAAVRWPNAPTLMDFAGWAAVLVATHLCFYIYNRVDKLTRVWLYWMLQLARSAGFIMVVPVTLIGAAAISVHVIARWIPYYIYRFGNAGWPRAPIDLTRLLFTLILGALLAFADGLSILLNWNAAAVLAWNLYRARKQLWLVITSAHRIDRAKQS